MKLRTLQSIILEQGPTDSGPDPFEPVPYDKPEKGTSEEVHRLQERKNAVSQRITAIEAHDRMFMHSKGHYPWYNHSITGTYSRNLNHLTNPASIPAGKVAWGSMIYDPSLLDADHRAFRTRYGAELNKLTLAQSKLDKEIAASKRRAKKAAADANVAALANSSAPTAPGSTLAPSQIPATIKMGPTSKGVANPYVQDTNTATRYAGPPSGYVFTSQMKTLYNAIEVALRRNGKTLSTIYAGRPYTSSGYTAINFIATTADGKFIWRKYDPSAGAGQNWVYLNGKQVKTSYFVGLTAAQQDALLKQEGVI